MKESVRKLYAEGHSLHAPFPVCPTCGKRVTVSWEAHEDECAPPALITNAVFVGWQKANRTV